MELTAIAAWLNAVFAGFDQSVAIAIHKLYEAAPGLFTPLLTLITHMGKGGAFLILLALVLIWFRPTRRCGVAMLLGLAIGALITNLCVKPLVARPRPYTWEGSVYREFWEQLGRHTESDKSFPSGHMTAAMAAATAVFLRGRRRVSWTAFLFAFAMGVSRIYLSVHYATDVLGGVIIGGVGGTAGYFLSKHVPEWFYRGEVRDLLSGRRSAAPARPPKHSRQARAAQSAAPALVLDGTRFSDLPGFYAEISRLLGSPEGEPVKNLDALNDILRGGFGGRGVYEPVTIRWLSWEKSREELGEETFRRITELLRSRDSGHECTLILE